MTHIGEWKQTCSKCYWIKKQIEPFRFHLLMNYSQLFSKFYSPVNPKNEPALSCIVNFILLFCCHWRIWMITKNSRWCPRWQTEYKNPQLLHNAMPGTKEMSQLLTRLISLPLLPAWVPRNDGFHRLLWTLVSPVDWCSLLLVLHPAWTLHYLSDNTHYGPSWIPPRLKMTKSIHTISQESLVQYNEVQRLG